MKQLKYTLLFTAFWMLFSCTDMEKEYDGKLYVYPDIEVNDFTPEAGRPGTLITINGKNFGDQKKAASVKFNGVIAETIESISDDKILVKVPEDAGIGPITVKVWTHEKDTESDFNYMPGAKVESLQPNKGKPGDKITIVGENFGTDANEVSITFMENQIAEIVSISDTQIEVIVPEDGITGPLSIQFGPQTVVTPIFSYPLVGLDFLFDIDGDNQGWTTGQNSTSEVSNGRLNVTFDPAQFSSSKRRADLKLNGGAKVAVGSFPILAIKMKKPESCNVILDTNFGTYDGGRNNWTGILVGDVYYFDLTAKPFKKSSGSTMLSTTEQTKFSTFQIKMADITSSEKGYSVDWVRSFESLESLKRYTALETGQYIFEFDDPNDIQWHATKNSSYKVEDGKLKVVFDSAQFASGKKRRADLQYVSGGQLNGQPKAPWIYSRDYPILAIKYTKPKGGVLKPDMTGGDLGNNSYEKDFVDDNVYYYDLSKRFSEQVKELSTFQFKIADITSPETGYDVHWVRTFKSVEDLKQFLGK
ncbi:DUF4979 domain-containing protein [Prolixibacteraceae bacterium JC049]|nr:DUF4979 domain-containing protein [Prolixibacteraceae bacterium JC049]